MTSRLNVLAAVLICLFGAVFISSYREILAMDRQLALERGERNLWAATQAERELYRLLLMAQPAPEAARLDLQAEILLSRLDLMLASPQREHFVALGLGGALDAVAQAVAQVDRAGGGEGGGGARVLGALPSDLGATLHDIATQTMLLERRERAERLQDRSAALRRLVISVVGAGCLGAAMSGVIVRNLLRLRSARDSLARLNATLEQQVERRSAELREALAVERRAREIYYSFIMAVSHQLRTPVSVIHIISARQLQTARPATCDPEVLRRKFTKIHRAAERLNDLLSTVLEAARIDADDFAARLVRLDFNDLVQEGLAGVARERPEVPLDVEVSRVPLMITGDRHLLEQVIQNVVGNALKYSDKGAAVTVRTLLCDGGVECRIRDRGVGIAPEVGDRVFDRFYRAPNARLFRGMGIGLYLGQQVVRLHGGRISYTSELGQGTEFRIFLPTPNREDQHDQ
ncbi:sensor histidine kinase [Pseudooceanicola nanhaiensis]|uniref:sensor histidine kinase n=1 Tax=Pseudooceanicola nanhaiensis TaxID=375761 RepID=UPI001CD2E88B|nr:HAMP domain-containing sensor histidine kinase [Pseudooceanicola nanhaiensis]MCA0921988.1 HAMP domain-containing histidine kinase [Pseudooceanicola nanhaiensis]